MIYFEEDDSMKKRLTCFLLSFVMMFSALPVSADESCTHDWSDWYITDEATCGEAGTETRYCHNCNEEHTKSIPATGEHEWSDWEIARSATISRNGLKERYCYYCDKTQTKKTSKLKPYAKLSKKSLKLRVGSSSKLKVSYAKDDSVKKWKSSKTRVATVSKKGTVKAKKVGTAKITVTLKSGKKATCTVRVIAKKKKKSNKKSNTVYWTPNGSVYHSTPNCPTLSRSKTICHGSLSSCPKSRPCKVCH